MEGKHTIHFQIMPTFIELNLDTPSERFGGVTNGETPTVRYCMLLYNRSSTTVFFSV